MMLFGAIQGPSLALQMVAPASGKSIFPAGCSLQQTHHEQHHAQLNRASHSISREPESCTYERHWYRLVVHFRYKSPHGRYVSLVKSLLVVFDTIMELFALFKLRIALYRRTSRVLNNQALKGFACKLHPRHSRIE